MTGAQKHPVAIVVDSAATLPADASGGVPLFVVPMSLVVDGRTYLDGVDMHPAEFYRLLKQAEKPPTTSAPSPERFLHSFRNAAKVADSVLCVVVSPRFSASYNSAAIAVKEAETQIPGLRIELLDSGSAAAGEALVAMEAIRVVAERGRSGGEEGANAAAHAVLEAARDAARDTARGVSILAFLDTLYYLWKGGRVPGIAHVGTSLLDLKPLFEMAQGEVKNLARPRTTPRARRRLVELMKERVGDSRVHAGVMHAGAPDSAEALHRMVSESFDCATLFTTEFSPVMGAHTGPGLLGLAFRPSEG